MRIALVASLLVLLAACASRPTRPAISSYSCMTAVRDALPAGLTDRAAHCQAAGSIAQRCSVIEARLAGIGKEVRDLFTGGDASWNDWRSDRAGIRCAAHANGRSLAECCRASGR